MNEPIGGDNMIYSLIFRGLNIRRTVRLVTTNYYLTVKSVYIIQFMKMKVTRWTIQQINIGTV